MRANALKITIENLASLNYGILQNIPGIFDSASVIDTRKLQKGEIFFALKGENTDGHNFVLSVYKKSPAFCVVEKDWYETHADELDGNPLWIVESSEKALQLLAQKVRKISEIPLLALTGTNGKTSTRTMIVSVLKKRYNVHSTTGNLNNQLGLPLSLLQLNENHDFSVLELGTNHFGEIELLCDIAKPDFALITNVGRGHTEFLGNPEGVAKAKAELFTAIPRTGTIFLNADDPYISNMKYKVRNVIRYGMNSDDVAYHGEIKRVDNFGRATITINNQIEIAVTVPGLYQAFNALAAATVGHRFGVSLENIKDALENHSGITNRLGIIEGICKIIDDTYNANPESSLAAIQTMSAIESAGKKYFILGDMLELGDMKEAYHAEIGEAIAKSDIDVFITHGPLSQHANAAARKAGHPNALHFSTKKEIIDFLNTNISKEDILLLKGSRGSRMEEIIEGI